MDAQLEIIFPKVKANPATTVLEEFTPEYVYSCTAPHCRHMPCIETPEYPPDAHMIGGEFIREYTLTEDRQTTIIKSRQLRRYEKFDDTEKYTDSNEIPLSWEMECM